MGKIKNHEMSNLLLRRPNEINFVLLESSSDERSSIPLKNNLGSGSANIVNNDSRGPLLLPYMGGSLKEVL